MSYQHRKLGIALGWKWNQQPGMSTEDGSLSGWPTEPWPTDQELAQWVGEYETYLVSTQYQDDELQAYLDSLAGKVVKTIATVLIDKGLCTMNDLKQTYRSL